MFVNPDDDSRREQEAHNLVSVSEELGCRNKASPVLSLGRIFVCR